MCRNDSDSCPVVFALQTKWQREMLHLYGEHMCLIDATYKTTVYDMPLFFLCVFANVGYVNVATFLLSDEQQTSIVAALRLIVQWNLQWKPQRFITDFHEGQISAIESVFPGMFCKLASYSSVQWHTHVTVQSAYIVVNVVKSS